MPRVRGEEQKQCVSPRLFQFYPFGPRRNQGPAKKREHKGSVSNTLELLSLPFFCLIDSPGSMQSV